MSGHLVPEELAHSIDGDYCLACMKAEGWVPFGTHASFDRTQVQLEFSGEDEDGLPTFERVVK